MVGGGVLKLASSGAGPKRKFDLAASSNVIGLPV
jgi:hypothetical protein